MRQNIVKSMKEYIQEQIRERGFDEYRRIEIDFSGLAEEEEIRQAAKELGFEVKPGEEQGVYWVYVEVEIRRNVVNSMKEYIQEQILERGFDEYKQIEIDFSGLAEEEEIRQAAKELGFEAEEGDIYGIFWIYEEV